jgi:hypothetical protein
MKINIQYIFTEEDKNDEDLCSFIDYLDRLGSEFICEVIADSDYYNQIDVSGEDKVEK